MKFSESGLDPKLLKALADAGYDDATEIQEKTLAIFDDGKHLLGQSQTGSGKTAAFVLPVLNKIDSNKRSPQVLILAPTRELASQIRDEVFMLSKHMYMRSVACFGGLSKRKQIQELKKWPQVVVGTPGRVFDLLDSRHLKVQDIDYFILDEVDRMVDMGFIDSIRDIWNKLDTVKQVLAYSATMPTEVTGLIEDFIGKEYEIIKVDQKIVVDTVDHMFISVPSRDKYWLLKEFLNNNEGMKTLVFTETKRGADNLAYDLDNDWFSVDALHGDMDQRDRFKTLSRIKNGEVNVLVATDVAARGLNMNDVKLVFNYEVPNDPESYIHRIGRTARAGKSGHAVMFVSREEMRKLHAIERINKLRIKEISRAGEEIERTDKVQRGTRKGWWGRGPRDKYKFSRGWGWSRWGSSGGNSRGSYGWSSATGRGGTRRRGWSDRGRRSAGSR